MLVFGHSTLNCPVSGKTMHCQILLQLEPPAELPLWPRSKLMTICTGVGEDAPALAEGLAGTAPCATGGQAGHPVPSQLR